MKISWLDLAHYGAGIGLIFLGVLGELHVPGISPETCFAAGAAWLTAGLKGGITSGAK